MQPRPNAIFNKGCKTSKSCLDDVFWKPRTFRKMEHSLGSTDPTSRWVSIASTALAANRDQLSFNAYLVRNTRLLLGEFSPLRNFPLEIHFPRKSNLGAVSKQKPTRKSGMDFPIPIGTTVDQFTIFLFYYPIMDRRRSRFLQSFSYPSAALHSFQRNKN